MTHYETRGAALDRFLHEHDVDPGDVLSVNLDLYGRADILVHIYVQLPGLEYVPNEQRPEHTTASVEREDLTINVVYFHRDDKEVAA